MPLVKSEAEERAALVWAPRWAVEIDPSRLPADMVVTTEWELVAAVARGGEVLVRAGATIELGARLEIATDCAIVREPGGAAPPVLRRKGGGDLIRSGEGTALKLRGLRLEGGGGRLTRRGAPSAGGA
eukprot:COSAG01_NODE_14277_length_1473_cov_11.619360_2_plen_127_part_01